MKAETLTAKERELINAIATSEYQDGGPITSPVWTNAVCETRSRASVLGSLIRKGMAGSHGDHKEGTCWLTDQGAEAYRAMAAMEPVADANVVDVTGREPEPIPAKPPTMARIEYVADVFDSTPEPEDQADPIIGWTTAPADYDGFGTETLDPAAGFDTMRRIIRKVAIRPEHYDWQTQRYGSGMYVFSTTDDVDRHVGGKYPNWTIAELAPPPAPKAARVTRSPTTTEGQVTEAAPCERCGTTKGWTQNGVHTRIRGCCKKCYTAARVAGEFDGQPRQPRAAKPRANGRVGSFIQVGDRQINPATIAHTRFAMTVGGRPEPAFSITFIGGGDTLDLTGELAMAAYVALGGQGPAEENSPD